MHQTHQSRLTTMSNQLEAKYEQRIHSLLEQIKANEPQKVKTDIHNGLMPNLFTIVRLISTLSLSRSRSRTLKKQELKRKKLKFKTSNQSFIQSKDTAESSDNVTNYDDLAKKKEHEYSDLQHEMSQLLLQNSELRERIQEYESKEESNLEEIKRLGVINSTNTSELRSIIKYQQLQEEQIQKEIDIAKHDLSEEFKQRISLQKATYLKETSQFQDKIDKLQFELNVCNDKLNQSKENQSKKSIMNETSAYKRDCDLHGGDDSEFKRLVHQHQKELSVLQKQFQSILNAKDDQINDLVYRVKKGQHHQERDTFAADDMDNEMDMQQLL
ncbi:hypothetical protein G6F42_020262 [Rhizopus arrhizus]|nr:hypothetical protein G6F42_020262 [Rhizopus arrhizus]